MLEDLIKDPRTARFPAGFLWGTATAALCVEGARGDAARGETIWDAFLAEGEGRRAGPERGCDHVHRMEEDIELMRRLGAGAYRFSIAWTRVFPEGRGRADPRGVACYEALLDALARAGIRPFPTLYYWDLPQALARRGGWADRDTASYFADFAAFCAERFGDRVSSFTTLNDPWSAAMRGYGDGSHAPGVRGHARQALHHLLLAHGHAAAAIREIAGEDSRVGIAVTVTPVAAARPGAPHAAAAALYDAYLNRLVLDPLLLGCYPPETDAIFGPGPSPAAEGDAGLIAAPLDFVGLNYYTRRRVLAAPGARPIPVKVVPPPAAARTMLGDEIYPAGLREALDRLAAGYGVKKIFITENGIPCEDAKDDAGAVRDPARVEFLKAHLRVLAAAAGDKAPVEGFFAWSLLDGFQWTNAGARCGLVHVDFDAALARTPKDSFAFLAQVIDAGAVPDPNAW